MNLYDLNKKLQAQEAEITDCHNIIKSFQNMKQVDLETIEKLTNENMNLRLELNDKRVMINLLLQKKVCNHD